EIVRTVATPGGRVAIAPFVLAKLALEALIDTRRAPASALDEYNRASAEALMQLRPGPFRSPEAATAWVNAASNRWLPSENTISVAELFPQESGVTMGGEDEGERRHAAMTDNSPKDWFMPTTFDNGEPGYLLTREGV